MARRPWPVGTLIAYRIMSSDASSVRNSSLWNHYVLLRVVKVEPFFGGKRKSMAVCLYDWTGESLPDPEIVKTLSFTQIATKKPMLDGAALDYLMGNIRASNISVIKQNEIIENLSQPSKCTFVLLDWICSKGIDTNAVFTVLGHDPYFEDHTPEIYEENTGGISLVHSIPFDVMLVNRFCGKQL